LGKTADAAALEQREVLLEEIGQDNNIQGIEVRGIDPQTGYLYFSYDYNNSPMDFGVRSGYIPWPNTRMIDPKEVHDTAVFSDWLGDLGEDAVEFGTDTTEVDPPLGISSIIVGGAGLGASQLIGAGSATEGKNLEQENLAKWLGLDVIDVNDGGWPRDNIIYVNDKPKDIQLTDKQLEAFDEACGIDFSLQNIVDNTPVLLQSDKRGNKQYSMDPLDAYEELTRDNKLPDGLAPVKL
jgi:hypothetical protein